MSLITRMEWPYQSLNHPNQEILRCPAVAEVAGLNPAGAPSLSTDYVAFLRKVLYGGLFGISLSNHRPKHGIGVAGVTDRGQV